MAEMTVVSGYPVRFNVEYPAGLSRWLVFVKWLLAIPHFVVLYFLQLAASIVGFIAFFAILFTKKYPKGLFDFYVGWLRWAVNVNSYVMLMRDEYPPFSWEEATYPVALSIEYPQELSRWLIFVKWLLAVPHYIVLLLLGIAAYFVVIFAFFVILFTKKFPESLFDFVVGVLRYQQRVAAYVGLLRDEYPPFSMQP
jgi:hypothetical protein